MIAYLFLIGMSKEQQVLVLANLGHYFRLVRLVLLTVMLVRLGPARCRHAELVLRTGTGTNGTPCCDDASLVLGPEGKLGAALSPRRVAPYDHRLA